MCRSLSEDLSTLIFKVLRMDLNFYSDLSGSCGQNVDTEFLDTQAYGEYSENKVILVVNVQQ